MKSSYKLLAALCVASFTSAVVPMASAVAAEMASAGSPAGTWKFTGPGRGGNPGQEVTITLDYKDGKLTGQQAASETPRGPQPAAAISDASFKDGVIAFSVSREFNGNTRVTKYSGKLAGDTITGTIETPGRDGATQKTDWAAKRSK